MTITAFSGDVETGVFSFGVNVQLTTLVMTADGETATANGSITVSMSAASGTLTRTVTSSSVSISEAGSTHTLSNYSLVETIGGTGFTRTLSGTLASTAFSGVVSFETTTSLQGTGASFAFAGEVVITGANDATIALIALDSTLVRLEIDVDGDGAIDESVDTTWAELI
jgi:hypothetical protein